MQFSNRPPGYEPPLQWSGYKPLLPAVGIQLILATEGVLEGYVVMDVIDMPLPSSTEIARRAEQEYLQYQGSEMENRYQKALARLQ